MAHAFARRWRSVGDREYSWEEKSGQSPILMSIDTELLAARALIERGDNRGALRVFERIRRQGLGSYEGGIVLLNEAKCLEFLGNFSEAWERLRELDRIDVSKRFHLYLQSAEINLGFSEGKLLPSIKAAEAFLSKYAEELEQDEYEDVRYGLNLRTACVLVTAGQFRAAIERLRNFLPQARQEDRPRILLFLGIAYEQSGEQAQAMEEFKKVLQFPDAENLVADANYRLGALYLKNGAAAWAKQHFLAVEGLKHALGSIPIQDLYTFLANASGYLGEECEREKYLKLAKTKGAPQ